MIPVPVSCGVLSPRAGPRGAFIRPLSAGRRLDGRRVLDPVCARFVTDSGSFLIIPAHSSAQGHRSPCLRHQTFTRTYTDCGLGLKILVSAVQSRPSPPFISHSCPSENFSQAEFVTRFVTNSGTLQRIPAHEPTFGGRLEGDLRVSAVSIPVRHSFLDR
jgi:hypothetical protein